MKMGYFVWFSPYLIENKVHFTWSKWFQNGQALSITLLYTYETAVVGLKSLKLVIIQTLQ
jgi:hypothetical protein